MQNLKLLPEDQVNDFIIQLLYTKKVLSIGFVNQHAFNLICSDCSIQKSFSNLDYLLRDGKGIEIACHLNGVDPGLNLNGTDFIPFFINEALNSHVELNLFAYGTINPWLESGASELFKSNCFFSLDGFQPEDSYISHFNQKLCNTRLNIVILAMGMPKQEKIASLIKASVDAPVIIICGGAILDFMSGKVSRAPLLFQKYGFEWLYRLFIEPKRLFKRYVLGIPVFFFNIFKYRI